LFTISEFKDIDRDEFYLDYNKFDFIFSVGVIESLMNPRNYLEQLCWSLRIDGTLCLVTERNIISKHYHEFDGSRLGKLLRASGYDRFKVDVKYGLFKKYLIVYANKG